MEMLKQLGVLIEQATNDANQEPPVAQYERILDLINSRVDMYLLLLSAGPNIPSMESPNASASRTKRCSIIASISCSTSPTGVNLHSSVRSLPRNFCSRFRGC